MMSACDKKDEDLETVNNTPNVSFTSKVVEKREDTVVIDVFSDLNVTFEGENKDSKVIFEYTGDNVFVKENVGFKCINDNRDFINGDTAIVQLDFYDYEAEKNNVNFKELEKEYTVEGLWGGIVYPNGYDFSELDTYIDNYFQEDRYSSYVSKFKSEDQIKNYGRNTFYLNYPDGLNENETINNEDNAEWEILSLSCEPVYKKMVINPNKLSGVNNEYYVIYKISIKAEKTQGDGVLNYKDLPNAKYHYGDIKEWSFIGEVKQTNASVEQSLTTVYARPNTITSSIITSDDKSYNADFDVFLENYLNEIVDYGVYYTYDFRSSDPHWEFVTE